jgi:AcrR family transcriptional regulator
MNNKQQAALPHRGADGSARGRARDRVIEVASDLFRNQGIRAVGVETIVKKAGVAKISLYRSFESKDDLIVAYLNKVNATYWANVDQHLARQGRDARSQLRAYMAYIAESATTPGYRGCPFINYSAEFPDPSHPGHRIAEANRIEMRRRLLDWAMAMKAAHPAKLADSLLLLIDGAYASSQTLGGPKGPAAALVWAADALIEVGMKKVSRSGKSRVQRP